MKKAYKFYNSALMDKVFEPESSMGLAGNLMVIPQVCLILRNAVEMLGKVSFEIRLISFGVMLIAGWLIRIGLKFILLKQGMKLMQGKIKS